MADYYVELEKVVVEVVRVDAETEAEAVEAAQDGGVEISHTEINRRVVACWTR